MFRRGDFRQDEEPSSESIGQLVGEVYETASANDRVSLIEHLMRPLSLMSLFAVANGIFARIWFRRDLQDLHIRLEDTQFVGRSEVVALVDFVQQASADTIENIVEVLTASPSLAASAAALLLIATLRKRSRPQGPDAGQAKP